MYCLSIYKFLLIIFPCCEKYYFQFCKQLNKYLLFKLCLFRIERTPRAKVLALCIHDLADLAPKANVQVYIISRLKSVRKKRRNKSLGLMANNLSFPE